MAAPDRHEVTSILSQASAGDAAAMDKLLHLVYGELRLLAEHHLQHERPGHTLQATALVHEAFIKLVDQRGVLGQNRSHFFALSAQAMRRILVDHARTKLRAKRGGQRRKLTIDDSIAITGLRDIDVLGLDDALTDLALLNERQARIVELRFFGGLTMPEVAGVLHVSVSTVEVDWRMAKAWLRRELISEESA